MTTVNTVLGPVDTSNLGFTLSHEHVMVSSAGISQTYPEFIDRQAIIEAGVEAFGDAYNEGLRSYVDMTTFDQGRDIRMLEEVSKRTGVHIISSTGSHRSIPRAFWRASPDDIARLYMREIEEGIEGTGIKAGVIKAASDSGGITDAEENVLRGVARAQRHTGVPISTHTWSPERIGEQQIRVLEEEGVDLSRVCIGHSNDDTDMDHLLEMIRKGVWLGLDRYPGGSIPGTPGWEQRTVVVKQIIDAGYGHRIMLSHDHFVIFVGWPQEVREQFEQRNPDRYLFITRRVLPRLRELGVSDEDIQQIMVRNPRHFFEGN